MKRMQLHAKKYSHVTLVLGHCLRVYVCFIRLNVYLLYIYSFIITYSIVAFHLTAEIILDFKNVPCTKLHIFTFSLEFIYIHVLYVSFFTLYLKPCCLVGMYIYS